MSQKKSSLDLEKFHEPYICRELGRWDFVLPIEPEGKKRPIPFARGKSITPAATRKAEKRLLAYAEEYKPPHPIEQPILLGVEFIFPMPDDWSEDKKQQALEGKVLHTTKPDLSNLLKLVEDALNNKFWKDDSQIFGYLWPPRKLYGPSGCIHVEIVVIDD